MVLPMSEVGDGARPGAMASWEGDGSDMSQPTGEPDRTLFISYRVADTGATASRLFKELADAYGRACVFIDHERLEGGAPWPERLEAAARQASVMLVLIGEGWLRAQDPDNYMRRLDQPGDWVRKEIEVTLGTKALVVPLLVEGAKPLRPYPGRRANRQVMRPSAKWSMAR